MTRISNVNSLSAIIDRLIIENLKMISYADTNHINEANSQNEIINALKMEFSTIMEELISNKYSSISENRTFKHDKFFENLFRLCLNNYSISVGDKLKIEEIKNQDINAENLKRYIHFVRCNLEDRAGCKNNIESSI